VIIYFRGAAKTVFLTFPDLRAERDVLLSRLLGLLGRHFGCDVFGLLLVVELRKPKID